MRAQISRSLRTKCGGRSHPVGQLRSMEFSGPQQLKQRTRLISRSTRGHCNRRIVVWGERHGILCHRRSSQDVRAQCCSHTQLIRQVYTQEEDHSNILVIVNPIPC